MHSRTPEPAATLHIGQTAGWPRTTPERAAVASCATGRLGHRRQGTLSIRQSTRFHWRQDFLVPCYLTLYHQGSPPPSLLFLNFSLCLSIFLCAVRSICPPPRYVGRKIDCRLSPGRWFAIVVRLVSPVPSGVSCHRTSSLVNRCRRTLPHTNIVYQQRPMTRRVRLFTTR